MKESSTLKKQHKVLYLTINPNLFGHVLTLWSISPPNGNVVVHRDPQIGAATTFPFELYQGKGTIYINGDFIGWKDAN